MSHVTLAPIDTRIEGTSWNSINTIKSNVI